MNKEQILDQLKLTKEYLRAELQGAAKELNALNEIDDQARRITSFNEAIRAIDDEIERVEAEPTGIPDQPIDNSHSYSD